MSAPVLGPCALLDLHQHADERGVLGVAELGGALPFVVRRFWVIDRVPPGTSRGGHAKRASHQLLVAVRGRIDVELDGLGASGVVRLEHPFVALHLPPMVWAAERFHGAAALLVCSSDLYDPADYVES